jgi:hypothetical protein
MSSNSRVGAPAQVESEDVKEREQNVTNRREEAVLGTAPLSANIGSSALTADLRCSERGALERGLRLTRGSRALPRRKSEWVGGSGLSRGLQPSLLPIPARGYVLPC